MINGGIFGPKLSGKTTLAKHLAEEYVKSGKVKGALVLDPHMDQWGPSAWVTADEGHFWYAVKEMDGMLVCVDEAAVTIRRDRELMPVFTTLRHSHHRLLVMGHSGSDLLPGMRNNLDTVWLFRQGGKIAQDWVDTFGHREISEVETLGPYEFMMVRTYMKPVRMKLDLRPPA